MSISAFRAYLPSASNRHPSCCIHHCVKAMFIGPVVAHPGPREITEGLMSSLCSKNERILFDHMLPKRWSAVCDGRGQRRLRYTSIDHLSIVVSSPLHRVPNDAQQIPRLIRYENKGTTMLDRGILYYNFLEITHMPMQSPNIARRAMSERFYSYSICDDYQKIYKNVS